MALDSRVPGPPALHRSLWHLWVIGRRGYPLTRNRAEMIVQIDIGGIGISWALFFLLEVINEHWDVPISRRVAAAGGGPGSRRGRSLEVAPSPPIPRNTALHRRFARLGHGRWPVRVGGLRCKRRAKPQAHDEGESTIYRRFGGDRWTRWDPAQQSVRSRSSVSF